MRCQQALNLGDHLRIFGAGEQLRPLRLFTLNQAAEQGLGLHPLLRIHGGSPKASISQARAIAHSRLTVAGDSSISSAVSSIEKPAK